MRIGVLTGGGDCPGLNAVIRAIVRKTTLDRGAEVFGFYDAWDGVMEQRGVMLDDASVRGTLPRGGTILGTRRGSPLETSDGVDRVKRSLADLAIDALVVIGGNGSLTVGSILSEQHGLPIVGVPKTIDNDVVGTDATFGFNTAVQIATDAIDRLHTTAESHDRVMVIEVMGRDAGWIALHAGMAGGATAILVPEVAFDINKLSDVVAHRHDRGRYASVVVVAEGAKPLSGLGSDGLILPDRQYDLYGRERLGDIAHVIAPALSARTGYDSRVVQLGYVQRGGTPTSYDRVLATRFGLAAVDAVRDRAFGQMVVLHGDRIERESMMVTSGKMRTIDLALFNDVANTFFG
ncbi:MAG: ATP-dependent 6-phosphofructokinase [Ilumatobacteraceae bacterium]|jgi:ATP-dependent phosphofructokinase / diphosphate-dependent phosphofructokinase|uniref:ATP-dependent 6-phosphofructokinase n=1 Tax=Acidimicrobiia bacterium BACL6 MAG-120924-bin43 TaxID=1655583 RepID=A0A0R2QD34_9ACTN|nr:MAG: 6-phosphofructokinase [Acidimicrobiia bacterium BACL6 MAG-120924-bin43]HAG67879.1 6-phosphofructokinase [Acidimicrobium sp.]